MNTTIADLAGVNAMGMGYDVNGLYADAKSLKGIKLFNFSSELSIYQKEDKKFYHPSDMVVTDIFESAVRMYFSTDIEDYRRMISANVGISGAYKLFNGSLSTEFSSYFRSLNCIDYATISHRERLWKITLPEVSVLKSKMTSEFSGALNGGESAEEVISRYGAYYVASIIVGGRIDYSIATKTLKVNSKHSIKSVMEAAYSADIGLKSTIEAEYLEEIRILKESSEVSFLSVGGKPGDLKDFLKSENPNLAIKNWARSLIDYAVMSEFADNSLCPIWMLADNADRQKDLRNATDKYLKSIQIPVKKADGLLLISKANHMVKFGTDKESNAKMDITVFIPKTSDNSFWSGQIAQSNYSDYCRNQSILFKDLFDIGLLKPPVDWIRIWDDAGSGNKNDYSCWRPIPPQGYVALGDVMMLREGKDKRPNFDNFVCVHKSLCETLAIGIPQIWCSHGMTSNKHLSVFPIDGSNCIESHTFVGFNEEKEPPSQDIVAEAGRYIGRLKKECVITDDKIESFKENYPHLSHFLPNK